MDKLKDESTRYLYRKKTWTKTERLKGIEKEKLEEIHKQIENKICEVNYDTLIDR